MSEELTFAQKKALPGYSDGYWDALDGVPVPDDATEGYRYGHEAASRASAMLTEAGFKKRGNTFSKTLTPGKSS